MTGNQFARVGLVKDPTSYGSDSILTKIKRVLSMQSDLQIWCYSSTFTNDLEFAKQLVSDQLRLVRSFLGMQTPEF